MNPHHFPIDEQIQACLDSIKELDFKESTIKRHHRHLLSLKDYLRSIGQKSYDENIGERYQFELLSKGTTKDYKLKEIRHTINLLNDIINQVPVRKKRVSLNVYPLPGDFGKHIESFLEQFRIESRPADNTMRNYRIALSHFATRMQQDQIHLVTLDPKAVSRFISSLQNTQLRVCVPIRRFLRYLFEEDIVKTDFSIPFYDIKCHRAEKLPSIYKNEEIRKMEASIERASSVGRRNYAIFLIASRLGLRASDIRTLQFNEIDWDKNVISLTQCKTKKMIELPLLDVIGEAIIDYIRNSRPRSDIKTIFLTAKAPYTTISVPGISSIVAHIIDKAGINTKGRHHGSHSLRHSLATRLMNQGTALPVISDVLGHSNSQTTMIYLNVDIKGLLQCSLDVPPIADNFYMQKGGWFYE
jgi:site-specific recombinase XerD